MAWLNQPVDWDQIVSWSRRWMLPVFFYGLAIGLLLGSINAGMDEIGLSHGESSSDQTQTEWLIRNQRQCYLEFSQANGTLQEVCVEGGFDVGYLVEQGSSYTLTRVMFPVQVLLGFALLFIAYRLTPKLE